MESHEFRTVVINFSQYLSQLHILYIIIKYSSQ